MGFTEACLSYGNLLACYVAENSITKPSANVVDQEISVPDSSPIFSCRRYTVIYMKRLCQPIQLRLRPPLAQYVSDFKRPFIQSTLILLRSDKHTYVPYDCATE
jgi:hypothetical protein